MTSNHSLSEPATDRSHGSTDADVVPALLPDCVCSDPGAPSRKIDCFGFALIECGGCGTLRRVLPASARGEVEGQYLDEYHKSTTRHPGCIPYEERYEHDRAVAVKRLRAYEKNIPNFKFRVWTTLDVGAANGAFVDYLYSKGFDATGLEVNPSLCRNRVFRGKICMATENHFDLITYHDVLEHLVDPVLEIETAAQRLRAAGTLVLDVPDVMTGAGDHHYKAEHLWYFTMIGLEAVIKRTRVPLEIVAIDRPIPGKLVIYASRKP